MGQGVGGAKTAKKWHGAWAGHRLGEVTKTKTKKRRRLATKLETWTVNGSYE